MGPIRLRIAALLAMVVAGTGGCRVPIRAEAELEQASLRDKTLRIVVGAWTLAANPIVGPKLERFHQYVLTYQLTSNLDRPVFRNLEEMPTPPAFDAESIRGVVLSPTGRRAVRTSEEDVTVVGGKAYAKATLDLLCLDPHSGRWKIAQTIRPCAFLLSPSGDHLVVYEKGKPRAIEVETLQEIEVPRLNELFAAAGASWVSYVDVPSYAYDGPPDYLGLTDEFDYASADGGAIYSRMLFERSSGRTIDLPGSVQPAGTKALFNLVMVRRMRSGGWRYLCRTDENRTLAILDDQFRVIATAPAIVSSRFTGLSVHWSWDADARVVVLYEEHAPVADRPVTVRIWRYGETSSIQELQLDVNTRFRESGNSYVPREKGT